ncbi:ATP-binding protein [Actinokineospora sp. NBRC 105648]|uniref:ATP-binding protein n=1 Tax=Actinokineospora sp. NBRC 105648 TaxID=3032206 RepID=UPI0024A3CACE|nr:ATP-binding protein [Actinokineospora sp. NBRC 105648]GLZ37045.1 hypothetical protein Acsp05_06700 [Actinokineospora sp. NBRC 105648]
MRHPDITDNDVAVFATTVPGRVEHLATLRGQLQRWLDSRRVPEPLREDVVLAAHEAVSDAIHQQGAEKEDTTVTLHWDEAGVVMTAIDHYTWTAGTSGSGDDRDHRLRLIARVAERVDLTVEEDHGTLTAYFTTDGD